MNQRHEHLSPTPLLQSAVRVVTEYDLSLFQDWYDDVFNHAIGRDVAIQVDYGDDDSMQIEVLSIEGARTSGVTLEIGLARDANGSPAARVRAIPHSDRYFVGEFTEDICGEIYVNSIEFATVNPLYVKFHLRAWWDATPNVLMGGIRLRSS